MRLSDPLKPRQLAILRWIADGCPPDSTHGNSHKHTARALQDRKLVTISRKGGGWTAAITDAGHHYLGHGAFPETAVARPRSSMKTSRGAASSRSVARRRPSPAVVVVSATDSPSESQPPRLSPTEQLVADVVAAGGTLDRPRDRFGEGSHRLQELVRVANRHRKPPAGKRLRHEVVITGSGFLAPSVDRITLEDAPLSLDAPLTPVPVPESVVRYHPVVSALRKQGRLDISAAVHGRALRLLHALAVEAERRGYVVAEHRAKTDPDRRVKVPGWHLLIKVGEDTVPLGISEEQDRVEHVPTEREKAEQQRHPWTRIPTHDHVPGGRLRIELGGSGSPDRRSFWADRASWRLEDKLPEVLREVAVRAEDGQLRRAARARAEVQYQVAVAREQQRARVRAAEAHRETVLAEQLERWREVRELRQYAEAVALRIERYEDDCAVDEEAVAGARRWLAWLTERADRRDPLGSLPAWPESAELQSYELEKFMRHVPEPAELRYRSETF